MNNYEDIYLRVTRFKNAGYYNPEDLFNKLCDYAIAGDCKEVKEMKSVFLAGEDPKLFKDMTKRID
jgi:hypothetical protein